MLRACLHRGLARALPLIWLYRATIVEMLAGVDFFSTSSLTQQENIVH